MLLKVYAFLLFALSASVAYAQCTGGRGTPVYKQTFGSGTSTIGPPLPAGFTPIYYSASTCPLDGTYSIINYTTGCFTEWHTLTDHTGDKNGYFFVYDSSPDAGDFYIETIKGLCEETNYEFAAFVFNMFAVTYGINPDLTISIENPDGTVIQQTRTGPIVMSDSISWNRYHLYFRTPPGVTTVVLRIRNNIPGGRGNDLALDDMTIKPVGPKTTIAIDGVEGSVLDNPCYTGNINMSSTVESCYAKNAYQWQTSTDTLSWSDIPGANQPTYKFLPSKPGTAYFRLVVTEDKGMGKLRCGGVNSNVLEIISHTIDPPKINNTSATICPADPYRLPSGKFADSTGIYRDTVRNQLGCDSIITTLDLTVRNRPRLGANALLCIGDSLLLNPGTFTSYLWQDGSRNSVYTVRTPGIYIVKVTDENGCETSDTILVKQSSCSIIVPPNTFTPNGDGINDTWRIDDLQKYPDCSVYIYTRWGNQVFRSIGYPYAWDGTYNGRPLPVGTYYYVIYLQDKLRAASGYVTIIR